MYEVALSFHNTLRYLFFAVAVIVIARSLMGLFAKNPYTKFDRITKAIFVGSLDLQIVLGIVLYTLLSPLTSAAFADMGAAMKIKELRFFAVEHIAIMIVAVIFSHLGSIMIRKAKDDAARWKRTLIYFGITLALVLYGIPWWRPLLRL